MRKLRGVSLIEVLVVMAVGTVIATMSIRILSQSQRNARQTQEHLNLQRGLTQWESQLRNDLRAATEVKLTDPQTIVLDQALTNVTYAVKPNQVERIEAGADKVISHEGYALPNCQVTITLPAEDQVLIRVEPQRHRQSSRAFTIRQSVGRP